MDEKKIYIIYDDDRCVCCGRPVLSGRLVCPVCEWEASRMKKVQKKHSLFSRIKMKYKNDP